MHQTWSWKVIKCRQEADFLLEWETPTFIFFCAVKIANTTIVMVFTALENRAENSGLELQGQCCGYLEPWTAGMQEELKWLYLEWGCGFWSNQLKNWSLSCDYKGAGRWGLVSIFCPPNWGVYIFLWLSFLLLSVRNWKFIVNSCFFSFFPTTIKMIWHFHGEGALS